MSTPVTVPKGTDISTRETKKGQVITCYSALWNGKLLGAVESFGDHVAAVTAARDNGTPLAAERDPEFSEQWKRWDVRLPRAGGGGWKAGGAGGGRPWTPPQNYYKGTPFGIEAWVQTTADFMVQAKALVLNLWPDAAVAEQISEARSIAAQAWIAVEKNMLVIPGHEPKAEPAPAAAAAAPAQDVHADLSKFYAGALAAAKTDADVDALMTDIRTLPDAHPHKAVYLANAMTRKREIAMIG